MGMIMHDDVPYGEGTSYTQGTGIAINNNVIAVDADNTPTENSEKPVKSKGVHSALEANSAESASLLKSTVGWIGKNRLPLTLSYLKQINTDGTWSGNAYTHKGVTYTITTDSEDNVTNIATSNTATDNSSLFFWDSGVPSWMDADTDYIMSGCPNGGSGNTYCIQYNNWTEGTSYIRWDEGNGITIRKITDSTTQKIRIWIKSNTNADGLNFKPMIRLATIVDSSFEPYHESVEEEIEQIYADNGVLGAKNLLPNNATSQTTNGIVFTVNDDGSVTANGTATTSDASLIIFEGTKPPFNGFILNGCPMGGEISKYFIGYTQKTSPYSTYAIDTGNGMVISIPSESENDKYFIYIRIRKGQTVENLTFYPMIRLASDPDDTYVPYAMTNRELTEDTQELKYRVGILSAKVPYYVANATMPRKKTLSSAELTEARARAAEQDYKTVVPGDIIIGPNTGSEYYLAKCWGRKGVGDSQPTGGAALTPNLMLMLYKPHGITRLWAGYGNSDKSWRVSANDLGRCPWNAAVDVDPTDSEAIGDNNTNITRAYDDDGTSVNVSGYMGSFIRKMLDERLLVDCFEADFGAANILPYRSMLGNAIKTDSPSGGNPAWNGLTNGWSWYTRKLDLPSEIELYGSIVWSSSGFDVGIQNEQLPFLKLGDIDLFFPRFDIWTKGVASSSDADHRNNRGNAANNNASFASWACPLACIK